MNERRKPRAPIIVGRKTLTDLQARTLRRTIRDALRHVDIRRAELQDLARVVRDEMEYAADQPRELEMDNNGPAEAPVQLNGGGAHAE